MSSRVLVFLLLTESCLLIRAELHVKRVSATSPDQFYQTKDYGLDTCDSYGASKLIENSRQCVCPRNASTFSLQSMSCTHSLPNCTGLSFLHDSPNSADGIFTLLLNRNYQITPSLPVLIQDNQESRGQKEICLKTSAERSAFYETVEGFAPTADQLIYTEYQKNGTYIRFNKSHIYDSDSEANGRLYKLRIGCADLEDLCLLFKINGVQKVVLPVTDSVIKAVKDEPSIRLSPTTAYIVGGTILGLVVLVACVATVIICVYKKRPEEEIRESTLLRVDRMKRLSLNLSKNHPLKMLVRHQSLPTLTDQSRGANKKKRHWNSETVSMDSGDSGRGKSRTPSTTAVPIPDEHPPTESDANTQGEHVKQPGLFDSQAQKLTTVGNGMTSIVESEIGARRHPEKRTIRSVIQRLFGNRKLARAKSDSKLSIDYEHFYIREAPKSKRFSESHINPEISFNEDGKIAQTHSIELEEQFVGGASDQGGKDMLDENFTVGKTGGQMPLPVTSIDDVEEVVTEFDLY